MRIFWTNSSSSFRPGADHAGARLYRYAAGQPGWISRLAVLAFAIVVALPIMLLIALAVLVSMTLFGTLALVNALYSKLAAGFRGSSDLEGRRNVTVIRHES